MNHSIEGGWILRILYLAKCHVVVMSNGIQVGILIDEQRRQKNSFIVKVSVNAVLHLALRLQFECAKGDSVICCLLTSHTFTYAYTRRNISIVGHYLLIP